MTRKAILMTATLVLGFNSLLVAQVVLPGPNGPRVVSPSYGQVRPLPYPVRPMPHPAPQPPPRFIPPAHGQYPVYVSPNEIVGVNPETGGLDTQNRQIDNTVYQPGRDSSQNNGTKRWVRRPVYNSQGQQVGYQEGWVWNNSYTGQEHGELSNYTPNGLGGVNGQHQSTSAGVHENVQSYNVQRPTQGGVHKNTQQYSPAPKAGGGVHKNIQSYSVQGR